MKNYKYILEAIQRGINLALDDFDYNEPISTQKSGVINDTNDTKNLIEIRKLFVDLALPSGTIWAKYNLGVDPAHLETERDWYGDYYAWGEIDTKNTYTEENYKYSEQVKRSSSNGILSSYDKQIKYNKEDKINTMELCDDAAYNNNPFKPYIDICTPSEKQYDELIQNTTSSFEKNYLGIDGLNVRIFTSKNNGKQIIFPLCGYMTSQGLEKASHECRCMCSFITSEWFEWLGYDFICGEQSIRIVDSIARRIGRTVRPVLMK